MTSVLRTHSKVKNGWKTLGVQCAAFLMTPHPPPRARSICMRQVNSSSASRLRSPANRAACLRTRARKGLTWVGFTPGPEVKAGFMSDSANLGGKRVKGVSQMGQEGTSKSAEHEDDTAAVMLCCSWWNMLKDIEDVQPNAAKTKGSIQLTMITPTQLYEEYKAAVQDDLVGFVSEDKFRHISGEKYDSVKIVKHQNVNSKVSPPSPAIKTYVF